MNGKFKDHFSGHADAYARFRPTYPDALFAYLASVAPARNLAWDCGTGSGQAAVALAQHFTRVVGSDASAQQIAHAAAHPRVQYVVAPAESPPMEARGAELVTVAQALHWFDFPRFYDELRSVMAPSGVFAAWGYGLMRIASAIDAIVEDYYARIVGPYWPPDRHHLETRYSEIPFPLEEWAAPSFEMAAEWDLDGLLGYLNTWSATQRYIKDKGEHPLELIQPGLSAAWAGEGPRRVTWPLFLRIGRCK